MGKFKVRIRSQDAEVIDKFQNHFVEQVNSRGMGAVTASARKVSDTELLIMMDYKSLGFWAFKKVVFPQIRKTAQKKDENAKVEILEEKKPSLKERLLGRKKKGKK